MISLLVWIYYKCNKNINIFYVLRFLVLALTDHLKWQEEQIWSRLNNSSVNIENFALKIKPFSIMNHDVKSQQKVSVYIGHTWLSQQVCERITER